MKPLALCFPFLLAASACAAPPAASGTEPSGTTDGPKAQGRLPTHCGALDHVLVGEGDALRIERSDGVVLASPGGMAGYVPVGLGCARGSGDQEYLVVQYGEAMVGCQVCEWFFVYDRQGRPMHDSVPAFTGTGTSLAPNNAGYTHWSRHLELRQPDIVYDNARINRATR